jgi:hypothetical protein
LVLLVFNVGCGGGPRLVSATGSVKLDGKPIPDVSVQFYYADQPRRATGLTDANGAFRMAYYNKPGAPVGPCKVVLQKRGSAEQGATGTSEMIPAKYNTESQLTIEVTKKGPNEFNFDLTSDPAAGNAAQPEYGEPEDSILQMPADDQLLIEPSQDDG